MSALAKHGVLSTKYVDEDQNLQVVKRSLEPVWREDWEVVVENAMLVDHTLDLEMWDKVG